MNKLCGGNFNQDLVMLTLDSLLKHVSIIQHSPGKCVEIQTFSQTKLFMLNLNVRMPVEPQKMLVSM